MSNTATAPIFESNFGFHPCDREHYKKLKKVRYYAHIQYQQQSALERWSRKLPHNRLCWTKMTSIDPTGKAALITEWKSEPWIEPELCPISLTALWLDYADAKPKDMESNVKPLRMPVDVLDAYIASAEAWLKRIGRENR